MRHAPDVTVWDPRRPAAAGDLREDQGDADELTSDGRPRGKIRSTVVGALLLGCAAGFAAAHAVGEPGVGAEPGGSSPPLVVVTDRDPVVQRGADAQPRSTVGVTLVNTGAKEVRVLGGAVRGAGLSWSAERPIAPGAQLTAVLADWSPCTGASQGLASSGATIDVDVVQDGDRRRLALPLPPSFLRDYDAEVRAACGRPVVHEALSVVLAAAAGDAGPDLAVPVLLANRTVEPVRLLGVSSALPGTTAVLRARSGADVPLPLVLPGRTLAQRERDVDRAVPVAASPYALAVTVERSACTGLRARGGESIAVTLHHAYDGAPRDTADTTVALDLTDTVDRACA